MVLVYVSQSATFLVSCRLLKSTSLKSTSVEHTPVKDTDGACRCAAHHIVAAIRLYCMTISPVPRLILEV